MYLLAAFIQFVLSLDFLFMCQNITLHILIVEAGKNLYSRHFD